MKQNLFTCDNCMKKEITNTKNYLYNKKWIYIYRNEIKIDDNKWIVIQNKHFCSYKCFITYLIMFLEKQGLII